MLSWDIKNTQWKSNETIFSFKSNTFWTNFIRAVNPTCHNGSHHSEWVLTVVEIERGKWVCKRGINEQVYVYQRDPFIRWDFYFSKLWICEVSSEYKRNRKSISEAIRLRLMFSSRHQGLPTTKAWSRETTKHHLHWRIHQWNVLHMTSCKFLSSALTFAIVILQFALVGKHLSKPPLRKLS